LVPPPAENAEFQATFGGPSLLPCFLPGCTTPQVPDEPSHLQVAMSNRPDLAALEARLAGEKGVLAVGDSRPLVDSQVNRFRHWRDWGLAGAAVLVASAFVLIRSQIMRRPPVPPERSAL
jgi:hypothetical protein